MGEIVELRTLEERYFDWHHTEADTFEQVAWRELELGTAAIAALGGALLSLRQANVQFGQYNVFSSILLIQYAVVGGVAWISGAMLFRKSSLSQYCTRCWYSVPLRCCSQKMAMISRSRCSTGRVRSIRSSFCSACRWKSPASRA